MAISVLFFPGWGFDGQAGALVPCLHERRWLSPPGFARPAMVEQAHALLAAKGEDVVHLLGWSMGANLACDFASLFPERVASLTLLAMRQQWPGGEIELIRQAIVNDKQSFLRDFYRKCFLGNRAAARVFTATLQQRYLAELDDALLMEGLDYLALSQPPSLPADIPVTLAHGRKDVIAPWPQRLRMSGARFHDLPHEGHFLTGFDIHA